MAVMPQGGLQIWNASAGLDVGLSTRMTRFMGYTEVTGSGSMPVPALAYGTAFVLPILELGGMMWPGDNPVIPTISGTTISWTGSCKFWYGVY